MDSAPIISSIDRMKGLRGYTVCLDLIAPCIIGNVFFV